jgi:hypothetical protein
VGRRVGGGLCSTSIWGLVEFVVVEEVEMMSSGYVEEIQWDEMGYFVEWDEMGYVRVK